MRTADREFFWLATNVQRPHFEFEWRVFIRAGEPFYLCRFTKCNYVRLGGCHRRSTQNNNAAQYTRGSGHARSLLPIGGRNTRSEITISGPDDVCQYHSKKYFGNDCRSGIAVLHRGGRAAIHGRVAQHERMSPFRAGLAGLKPRDLLNPLRGSKEPLFHLTPVRMAWSETTLCKAEPARGLWKSGHLWPRCATRKTVAL